MAPKKKDKEKLSDWLQCSLCGKLVSSQDAESHSVSCDSDHGNIQGRVFHGKVIRADDGSFTLQNIRDKGSVVWLAIPTMQICGLSIGQPCIVNKILVKRSWPLPSLPLSKAALSDQCIMELGTKEDAMVTVERFFPNENLVKSAVLTVREPSDPVFEKAEFLSFITAYLDGKYITQGTPLTVKYFGKVCHCYVSSLTCDIPAPPYERTAPELDSPAKPQASVYMNTSANQTPQRHTAVHVHVSAQGSSSLHADGNTMSTFIPDVSQSVADLDIASLTISPATSTPKMCPRETFPNLMTPISNTRQYPDSNSLSSEVFAKVSSKLTTVSVLSAAGSNDDADQHKLQVSLADVGGMTSEIEELKIRIFRALQPNCRNRGILLHGPTGTGKSLLVKALTHHLDMATVYMAGTDVSSKFFEEAASHLHKVFSSAQDKAPSIVVIDGLDVMCPKRSQLQAWQQEYSVTEALVKILDDLSSVQSAHQIVVIGITNSIDAIDQTLRRPGRFGCEVKIGVPTAAQRTEILEVLLNKVPHNLTAENIEVAARNAHGYVGADLCALVNEAEMCSLSCQTASAQLETSVKLVALKDLLHAGLRVKPSALREKRLEVPSVKWTDIGGMSEVKMRLREAVELPRTHPEVFRRIGIQPPKGLLMYGPPGCSKTMVARALATECRLNFLAVKGPELFNKYVGESEKSIREVFHKARLVAPSIIFFDEIDAIAVKRASSTESGVQDRVLTQLLAEMDGLEFLKDVFIMAATNRPDMIDHALLRPGRFDSLVYVPLPDADTRRQILEKRLNKICAQDVSLELLVESTQKYSGAEVLQVCQEAAFYALREDNMQKLHARHFDAALGKVKPQTDPHLMKIYAEFSQSRSH